MKNKLDTFIETLRTLLESKKDSKSINKKLDEPEKLAEQMAREIGSDTQRISFHE